MSTNRPLPEAIDGRPWSVTITDPAITAGGVLYGVTDLTGRKMILPPESHPAARFTRLHELAHAKWTPPNESPGKIAKRANATLTDVQVCEDLRVQTLLHLHDLIPTDIRQRSEQEVLQIADTIAHSITNNRPGDALETLTWQTIAAGVATHKRTPTYGTTGHRLTHYPALREELDAIRDHAKNQLTTDAERETFHQVCVTADRIAGAVVAQSWPKRCTRRLPFRPIITKSARLLRSLLTEATEHLRKPDAPKIPNNNNPFPGQWGSLVERPPLPLTVNHRPTTQPRKTRKAQNTGSRLGSIRRWLTDGRVFRRSRNIRQKGGTVLIDTSGSMDLNPSHVAAILIATPAATVAIYSGEGTHGTVSIIAKNGRMADARAIAKRIEDSGGGNIVDGPALRWLAKQPGPRTWICDGLVTGCNDRQALNLAFEAGTIQRAANIARHPTVRQYLDTLPPC